MRKVYPNKTHYSKHFTRAELDCKCPRHVADKRGRKHSRAVRIKLRILATKLEKMRKYYGGPFGLNSGYRCPAHNKEVHGAVDSQHIHATAADIHVPGATVEEKKKNRAALLAAAEKVRAFRNGGIGTYPTGDLHVDRRGWRARWSSWVGQ